MRITDEEMRAAVDQMTRARAARRDRRVAHSGRRDAASHTVFLVNPASANGSTGRRWPELARRAAADGLEGDDALHRAAGPPRRARARGGATAARSCSSSSAATARSTRSRTGSPGASDVEIADDPARHGLGLRRARTGSREARRRDRGRAGRATSRTIDLGRATLPRLGRQRGATAYFANVASAGMSGAIAQRANETTKALGGKVSYLWATFAVFAGWQTTEMRGHRRRRAARGRDARRRRRQRPLLRRRA